MKLTIWEVGAGTFGVLGGGLMIGSWNARSPWGVAILGAVLLACAGWALYMGRRRVDSLDSKTRDE